jgi:hypothetical protein
MTIWEIGLSTSSAGNRAGLKMLSGSLSLTSSGAKISSNLSSSSAISG